MKLLIGAVVAMSIFASPLVSFAQSDSPVTRAQVRTELRQLESAGYTPSSGDEPNYPANIQAAEARVSDTTGYGGTVSGSSASGGGVAVRPASTADMNKLYFGGQ
ncbi:protein of unknown function [Burkholderia sp. WP9]|uniref:DUF4148 domain-containing protein n=1 Tax=Burkholderia sp. WP9 TaxID=1500263 RepID=UPI00089C376D|nr:DUF4148 domain-containing protein [Burkholderia sp. WP9]SEB95413.1 protein of unknown function [Burkholderia sp. WP9]